MRAGRGAVRLAWSLTVAAAAAASPAAIGGADAGRPRSEGLAPALLVATAQIADPRFAKTVILLVTHGDGGAVGLVLNRPSRVLGADVGRRLRVKVKGKAALVPVLEGGPVDPTQGFVVHGRRDLAEGEALLPGLWVDDPAKVLETMLREGELGSRLVVGYSGWARGQLENEIARGDWAVVPASVRAVFEIAPEALWETVRREHALHLEGSGGQGPGGKRRP